MKFYVLHYKFCLSVCHGYFWQLHKNAASNTEQVLETAPQKAAVVWPPTIHHEKLSKLDEQDIRDTAREVVMYSHGPLQIDEQRQDVQLEPTYSSSVPILDVA